MTPCLPDKLPLDRIDWARHVGAIGQANAAVARYDGILEILRDPSGRTPALLRFPKLMEIADARPFENP